MQETKKYMHIDYNYWPSGSNGNVKSTGYIEWFMSKENHTQFSCPYPFYRIKDIRDFIIQSRPTFATTDFVLVTTFPNKELTDESLTLQEADILNTVILQQLK